MGLESFNLILNCPLPAGKQERVLAKLEAARAMRAQSPQTFTSELIEPDFIIQMKVMASAASCSVSIRTALCCADRVVAAMLELARRVTADLGAQPQWDIFNEQRSIDVTSDATEAVMRECFAGRRKRLYEGFGIASVPCAAKRPGNECLRYVHSFSDLPLKERPGEPPKRG